jgi:hypothetical protein
MRNPSKNTIKRLRKMADAAIPLKVTVFEMSGIYTSVKNKYAKLIENSSKATKDKIQIVFYAECSGGYVGNK